MRIRTKLLIILLGLVIPPLLATSYLALREARNLGHDLADREAFSFKRSAERELALMVDLIGEDIDDNRRAQELSVSLLSEAAGRALAGSVPAAAPVYFDDAFAGGLPAGLTRLSGPDAPLPDVTADAVAIHVPTGISRASVMDDARRLDTLLPTLELLHTNLAENMLWAYVALPSGLLATFPAHGPMPSGYDARAREWYKAALKNRGPIWRILVDAATKRLTATVSVPIRDAKGHIIGIAGLDAPFESMLPESDLSKRWGNGVRALVVVSEDTAEGRKIMVLGDREFLSQANGWNTPVMASSLKSDDTASVARLESAMDARQSVLIAMPLDGVPSFAAYRPFLSTEGAGLLVVVPRSAVLAQADSAESSILARTKSMIIVVAAFTLLASIAAVILAAFGARAVTRPVMSICRAVDQLAQGDLSARAPVAGRDELADLAQAFNDMAPELSERLRLKQDMLLAMEVQQNLLPKAPPKLPGLDIAGATFFCDETGGDYYDYLQFSQQEDKCDVVLGDVTGHGISAALFMATGRALLRGGADPVAGPARLLDLVNGLLCQDTGDSGRFITLFFLRLEKSGLGASGRLVWTRAGHDPALLYDPETDGFDELMGPGIPLGVVPDFAYAEQSRPGLAPGQFLVMGTDGIWEARNPAGEMYGKDRFREVLRRHRETSADEIIAAVYEDVTRFQAGHVREDDITLVIVRALPAA